jgi:hypothetical protein
MAVSIAPNPEEINGRPPLRLGAPLPWNDAFYWTVGAELPHIRIIPNDLDPAAYNWIDSEQQWRLGCFVAQDEHLNNHGEYVLATCFPLGN